MFTWRGNSLELESCQRHIRASMKVLFLLICAWVWMSEVQSDGATARLKSVQISGQKYVNLQDWSAVEKLEFAWIKTGDELRLASRSAKLLFKADSQRAELNGIAILLSFPVAAQNGMAYIAQKDINETLVPLLHPQKNRKGQRIRTIALCPGHGGKDPGNEVGAHQEKKYTLLLAREVQALLAKAGLKIVLTRSGDEYVGLEERSTLTQKKGADLYVCLHYNCANPGNHETKGVEVYCLTPAGARSSNDSGKAPRGSWPGNRNDAQNVLLAYELQKALVSGLGMADRGVKRARFEVLRNVTVPGAFIEAGFMSSPSEMQKIQDASHRRRAAQAITEGLLAYKRLVER
jgi:N-acetylmuramoyl-L-alanine amidase